MSRLGPCRTPSLSCLVGLRGLPRANGRRRSGLGCSCRRCRGCHRNPSFFLAREECVWGDVMAMQWMAAMLETRPALDRHWGREGRLRCSPPCFVVRCHDQAVLLSAYWGWWVVGGSSGGGGGGGVKAAPQSQLTRCGHPSAAACPGTRRRDGTRGSGASERRRG